MTRDDPELGPVRLCPQCHEEWPFDADFWHLRDGRLHPGWPPRCIACCADYSAARRRIRQVVTRENRRTPEPVEGRCNRLMESHDRCGRFAGHGLRCRSVTAMERERQAKTERRAA